MPRVLILLAHPQMEDSRVARSLVDALQDAPPGAAIELRDLYSLYPDYLVDVAAEQAALQGVDLLVWLHPIHWYGMPPLMKLWLDEVLRFGWAYGPGGQALQGKDLWLALSTGGPKESYRSDGHNRYFFDAFLPPYEQTAALVGMRMLPPLVLHGAHRSDGHNRYFFDAFLPPYEQTAALTGMRFLPPLVLHGAHRCTQAELQAHAEVFVQRLHSYPAWPELDALPACPACEVPADARPAATAGALAAG